MPAAKSDHNFGTFWIYTFALHTYALLDFTAILAIKRGNVRKHKIKKLTLLYIGAYWRLLAVSIPAPGRYNACEFRF
jgi:hypothetical protein